MASPPAQHTSHWGQVLGAMAGGAMAGGATFGGELLTPLGNAVVTGIATVAGALMVTLATPPRVPALVGLALCAAGGTAAVVQFREEPPSGVAAFVGGCEPFTVYAQDRWRPRGAAVRMSPVPESKQVGTFSGNELVAVDGWVRTRPAYPSNPTPFDNEYWFHLADDSGWVSFAAVRADPTPFDRTGQDPNGGRPAPLDPDCSGVARFRNTYDER